MSNLSIRILSSIILIMVFCVGICWNRWTQWFLLSSVFLISSLEISFATRSRYASKSSIILPFLILVPALYSLLQYFPHSSVSSFVQTNISYYYLYLVLFFFVSFFNSNINNMNRFPWSLYQIGFLLLIPTWFSTFFKILTPFEPWNPLFWNCILVIILSDCGAYFVGTAIGKHKIFALSSQKTLEGFLGGLLTSVSLTSVFTLLLLDIPLHKAVILNIILSLCSTLGDLFFSALKRHFEIKDFSNTIPGHGGVLDRFDSILFTIPISYFLLPWIS